MLQTLLAYAQGAGIENRWLVLDGDPDFFTITKRIHNRLHGDPGDGGPLGAASEPTIQLCWTPTSRRCSLGCPRVTSFCCTTHRPPDWQRAFAATGCTSPGVVTSDVTIPLKTCR